MPTRPCASRPRRRVHAAFAADPIKAKQWNAFLVRARVRLEPPPFEVVVARVAEFLQPVAEAARLRTVLRGSWPARGPWERR